MHVIVPNHLSLIRTVSAKFTLRHTMPIVARLSAECIGLQYNPSASRISGHIVRTEVACGRNLVPDSRSFDLATYRVRYRESLVVSLLYVVLINVNGVNVGELNGFIEST